MESAEEPATIIKAKFASLANQEGLTRQEILKQLSDPSIVREIFHDWITSLNIPYIIQKIPSLNGVGDLSQFNHKIVRFTCMVQENEEVQGICPLIRNIETDELLFDPLGELDSSVTDPTRYETLESVVYTAQINYAVEPPSMTSWARSLQNGVINEEIGPSETMQPRGVTLYLFEEKNNSLPINEVIEVYGYFSIFDDSTGYTGLGEFKEEEEQKAERRKYQLTVFKTEKQGGELSNALLRGSLSQPLTKEYLATHLFKQETASTLRQILTQLLGGDTIAAEYTLLNLVSKYYQSKDLILFDNFPLNLIGMSELDQVDGTDKAPAQVLIRFIQHIKEFSIDLPFSLKFLNSTRAIPRKNYDKYVLETGFLQQANSSQILINEVGFEEGQINETGMKGLFAIKEAYSKQELLYDFQYNNITFKTNYSFLILSEARSLLHSPALIQLFLKRESNYSAKRLEELSSTDLWRIRNYFRQLRLEDVDITMTPSAGEWATEKYLKMREGVPKQAASGSFLATPEFFSHWLTMARLRAFAEGKGSVDTENLEECFAMIEAVFERKKEYEIKVKQKKEADKQ